MKVSKLTLQRTGEVFWRVQGHNHCGVLTSDGHWTRYTVSMVCRPETDKRGFLVDQLEVHEFVRVYASARRKVSCEKSCINLAKALMKFLRANARHCKVLTLSLTLSPEPYLAAMTAEME